MHFIFIYWNVISQLCMVGLRADSVVCWLMHCRFYPNQVRTALCCPYIAVCSSSFAVWPGALMYSYMGELTVWIVFRIVAIRMYMSSSLVPLDSCVTAASRCVTSRWFGVTTAYYIQINTTEVQINTTEVQINLIQINLNRIQINLCEIHINLNRIQINLCEIHINLNQIQINLCHIIIM